MINFRINLIMFVCMARLPFMEKPVVPGGGKMERFIPMEVFRKKVIPSKVLHFYRFHRYDRNFLSHLSALLEQGSSAIARNIACQNMAGSSDSYRDVIQHDSSIHLWSNVMYLIYPASRLPCTQL